MTADLKPCPFCGGEAKWVSGGPGCAYVKCTQCPAETSDGNLPRIKASWNTRADAITPAAAAKVLLAAMTAKPQVVDPFDAIDHEIETMATEHSGQTHDPVMVLETAEKFMLAALRVIAERGGL